MEPMIDTHAHLTFPPLSDDPTAVVLRARKAGVTTLINVGTDIDSSAQALSHSEEISDVYAAVGIHPECISQQKETDPFDSTLSTWTQGLEELAHNDHVVAVGECGLDYTYAPNPNNQKDTEIRTQQKRLFGTHIQLALTVNKPLLLHVRHTKTPPEVESYVPGTAYYDTLDTLKHFSLQNGKIPPFVLHCISGGPTYVKTALSLGGYISFAGNITYPTAQTIQKLLSLVPLDRLLVETDCPFLPPQGKRGTPNEPSFIRETVSFIASALGKSFEEIDHQTSENAKRLFSLPP